MGNCVNTVVKIVMVSFSDRPYDLRLTFCKFIEWKRIGMPGVLPLTIAALNEIYHLGIKDKEALNNLFYFFAWANNYTKQNNYTLCYK